MAKKKSAKKASWTPNAYNINNTSGSPINFDQGPYRRMICFGGPAVWNVPQDKTEEKLLEHEYNRQGSGGFIMRKLPYVKQREDGFWLPDKEAIKAFLEDEEKSEEE